MQLQALQTAETVGGEQIGFHFRIQLILESAYLVLPVLISCGVIFSAPRVNTAGLVGRQHSRYNSRRLLAHLEPAGIRS